MLGNELDFAIEKLISVKSSSPGTEVNLPEDLLIKIVRASRDIHATANAIRSISTCQYMW